MLGLGYKTQKCIFQFRPGDLTLMAIFTSKKNETGKPEEGDREIQGRHVNPSKKDIFILPNTSQEFGQRLTVFG